MRFAIVSNEGTSLSLWSRLVDEGEEVLVWIAPMAQRGVGDGIVNKVGSFGALAAWGAEKPTVFIFDCSGQGEKADWLRKRGHLVVGGGGFMDKLEQKREWGEEMARKAGVHIPETHPFTTLSASISWLKGHDDGRGWYFKADKYLGADATQGKGSTEGMIRYLEFVRAKHSDRIKHILQEKIDGMDLSTAAYWNGKTWLGPIEGTIEHKKVMNDDIGPSTGCSFNIIWFYENYPRICQELKWNELGEIFRGEQAPPGLYDVNALVAKDDGRAYFLEWTPRFGYDSEPTAWRGLTVPAGEFFYGLATGTLAEAPFDTTKVQMSIRLSVPPYPLESVDDLKDKDNPAVGLPVWGTDGLWDGTFVAYGVGKDEHDNLVVKDPTGLLGLAATSGTDLEDMNEELVDFCKDELDVSGLQYRSDADKKLGKHVDELRKLGYDIPLVETK